MTAFLKFRRSKNGPLLLQKIEVRTSFAAEAQGWALFRQDGALIDRSSLCLELPTFVQGRSPQLVPLGQAAEVVPKKNEAGPCVRSTCSE